MTRAPLVLRRTVALLILAGVLTVLTVFILQPAFSVVLGAVGNTQNAKLLAGYRQIIAEKEQWEGFIANVQGGQYSALFMAGDDENLAAAQFQTDIKNMIEAGGGTVQSIEVLSSGKEAGLVKLGVRANFTLPAAAAAGLLTQIEHGNSNIFLDNFSLTVPEMPAPADGEKKPLHMTMQSDFHAYLQPVMP
jgi:hypothetical protein